MAFHASRSRARRLRRVAAVIVQPSRIFKVTGREVPFTAASISRAAQFRFAHQRRARQRASYFFRRTAHVEIDDVGAGLLGQLAPLAIHSVCVPPIE